MALVEILRSRFQVALLAEILRVIAGGILIVLLARLLSPDAYGLLFLALSILILARSVGTLGIPRSAARYISKYKETDVGQIPHVLAFAFKLNLALAVCLSLVFVVGHEFIATVVGVADLSLYLLFGSFYIVCSTLFVFVRIVLQSFEDIKLSSVLTGVNETARLCIAVALVLLGFGGLGALAGYITGYFLVALAGLLFIYVKHHRKYEPSSFNTALRRRIVEYAVPITVTKSGYLLDQQVDKILVGFFLGPAPVAYYAIGKQVVEFVETPMHALGFTLAPTYSSQKAQGNVDTAARIYETALSKGLALYIPAAAGIILFARPGIEIVFGEPYLGAAPVLQVLALFAVLLAVTKLTSASLDYLGRARERAIARVSAGMLNVVLNILLIPVLGVVGAAITTVVSYSIYTGMAVLVMHRELDLRTGWLLRQVGYALVVASVMSAAVVPLRQCVNGIATLLAVVGFGVLVWFLSVVLLGIVTREQLRNVLT